MADRKWCPCEWMDEVCPVNVSDPSETLVFLADRGWCMVKDDFLTRPEGGPVDDYQIQPVKAGDVVLFSYSETRGTFDLVVQSDGSAALIGVPPHDANYWWVPSDWSNVSGSLDELVREGELEPGTVEVEAYFWSDDIAFRFEIVDGAGRFVQVAAH